MKIRKIKNILIFVFVYLFIDLTLTQLFFRNIYYKKLEKQFIYTRIQNVDYKYTFIKKASFKTNYQGYEYTIKTKTPAKRWAFRCATSPASVATTRSRRPMPDADAGSSGSSDVSASSSRASSYDE